MIYPYASGGGSSEGHEQRRVGAGAVAKVSINDCNQTVGCHMREGATNSVNSDPVVGK